MQKWEYTTLTQSDDNLYRDNTVIDSSKTWEWVRHLNMLGDQGWELVSTIVRENIVNKNTSVRWQQCCFKRPKP